MSEKLIKDLEQMISDDLKQYWFHAGVGNLKRANKIQDRINKHEELLKKLKKEVK